VILNCDIGERGADHPVDRELMRCIGLANLACGGHAGDTDSIRSFRQLAERHGVAVAAHLSYPDRAHFGRVSMNLPREELLAALDTQWSRVPGVTMVKFHGALYNDSVGDPNLAGGLADWLSRRQVGAVVCPGDSEMASAASALGLVVLEEAFLERRYRMTAEGRLELVPRIHPMACITEVSAALDQARSLMESGEVIGIDGQRYPLQAQTLCIHSDSPIALKLVQGVVNLMKERP
jgi:UPF0271 protein